MAGQTTWGIAGTGSLASRDRLSGQQDRYSGNEDRYSGHEERHSGNEDRCCGHEDRHSGNEDRCSGNEDRYWPAGHKLVRRTGTLDCRTGTLAIRTGTRQYYRYSGHQDRNRYSGSRIGTVQ